MFSLLQAIQGRWFSICLDDVLHVEYSRPHKLRSTPATGKPPAKANPAYAKPIPAWPPAKAMPKVIPAKIGFAAYQPRCVPPKARPLLRPLLQKLGGPPKPKRLASSPKQSWTKRSIPLKTARGTVARPPPEETVTQEEWLAAKEELDLDGDIAWMEENLDVPCTPEEQASDDEQEQYDPYKVESDDSEDGQSISYYRNSFNNIIVTFLTPPQATYPTLPSQPPLPYPYKLESDDPVCSCTLKLRQLVLSR